MHTGEMLTQRFILNDFCQQLTLQSNIKLADYVKKDTTKDTHSKNQPSLDYTLNPKLEKQWKEKKLERYVYCYSNAVQSATNKQLSAVQFVTYALYKEALITARTFNAKNKSIKIPEFENVQAILNWAKKIENKDSNSRKKKLYMKSGEAQHILNIAKYLNGSKPDVSLLFLSF